jgi:hypothetical protein
MWKRPIEVPVRKVNQMKGIPFQEIWVKEGLEIGHTIKKDLDLKIIYNNINVTVLLLSSL